MLPFFSKNQESATASISEPVKVGRQTIDGKVTFHEIEVSPEDSTNVIVIKRKKDKGINNV